jgi:ribulose-phosphate 3-epimerase
MVEVIPSILTANILEVKEKIERAEGTCKRVQIDIVDGVFNGNKTIDPSAVETIENDLNLDFHLMTKEPVDWVERAVRGGAERIIGQIEKMTDQLVFVGKVQEVGSLVGLAIDLDTPVSHLDQAILNNLDVILVMSVKAGLGGQRFDDQAIAKIKELVEIRAKDVTPYRICVDGGILPVKVKELASLGVDEIVVGKRLFDGDLAANLGKYTMS